MTARLLRRIFLPPPWRVRCLVCDWTEVVPDSDAASEAGHRHASEHRHLASDQVTARPIGW
jgi:hypothetical protein